MQLHKLEVGMTIIAVKYGHHRDPSFSERKVIKVGRKWAILDDDSKINIENWQMDGGQYSSPGICYPSEQYYLDKKELDAAWSSFREDIRYANIKDVTTVERIQQVRELLGFLSVSLFLTQDFFGSIPKIVKNLATVRLLRKPQPSCFTF